MKEYETRGATHCEDVVRVTADLLRLGDHINCFADQPGAAFGWAVVTRCTQDVVEYTRPYVHISPFEYSSGIAEGGSAVIAYTGLEVSKVERRSDRVFSVVFRTQVPR
jgi:hypothetical protein